MKVNFKHNPSSTGVVPSALLLSVLFVFGCNLNNYNNKGKRDTSSKIEMGNEENLEVSLQTQLVEWGGDGRWHEMYSSEEGRYWVNYSDPFKLILNGNYSKINVKVKTSNGKVIYSQSNINISEGVPFVISQRNMIGEVETIFNVEIFSKQKLIFKYVIESVPGGE